MITNQNCSKNKREIKEFHTLSDVLNIGHLEVVTGCEHVTSSRNT